MHKPFRKLLSFVLLALFVSACSTSGEQPEPSGGVYEDPVGDAPLGVDAQFLAVSDQAPGFAGMYYDEAGELVLLQADGLATLSQETLEAAVTDVFGDNVLFQQIDPESVLGSLSRGEEPATPARAVSMKTVTYSFAQLNDWRTELLSVWDVGGVRSLDSDEVRNRVVIGVADEAAATRAEAFVQRLNLPSEAVIVELVPAYEAGTTLRQQHRPLMGGLQIEFDGFVCTMGFNARRGSVNGFVTNAHCGSQQGVVTPTSYRQGGAQVGTELVEAPMWNCGSNRCRWADAAFVRYDGSQNFALGQIAYVYSGNDLEVIDDERAFAGRDFATRITETGNPLVGERVYKVGRTTGKTSGRVTQTNVDVGQNGTNIVNRAQALADYAAQGGDSGSPVYELNYYARTGWRVELKGINWSQGSSNVFSPYSNVQSALGNMRVTRYARTKTVYDGYGAGAPDFRQLTVSYDDDQVTLTVRYNSAADVNYAGDFVYLYGADRHSVSFSRNSFQLRKDAGADGHFEQLVTSGSVQQLNSTTLQIRFSARYMDDIHAKEVWAYSMRSRDRAPNSGALTMD